MPNLDLSICFISVPALNDFLNTFPKNRIPEILKMDKNVLSIKSFNMHFKIHGKSTFQLNSNSTQLNSIQFNSILFVKYKLLQCTINL